MATLYSGAYAAILTGRVSAEVDFGIAVPSHVPGFAVAVIVIDELHAVLCTGQRARVREALVDVAFTPRSDEAGRTLALEAADSVDASAVVMTRILFAIVNVYFAYLPQSAERAGA